MQGVHVVDHPVLAEAMTVLRASDTSRVSFRTAMSEAAAMLAYEATRGLPVVRAGLDADAGPVGAAATAWCRSPSQLPSWRHQLFRLQEGL